MAGPLVTKRVAHRPACAGCNTTRTLQIAILIKIGAQCRAQEMIVQLDLSNKASVNEFVNVLKSDGSHREGDVVPSPPQSEAGNYKSEAALQI